MENFDLLIVGGGVNGAAIARDAAGREQKVLLVEKDDLGAHTSSASSKLIHGGLRYLEQYEFRLVRESLKERAILLRTAPHIVRPLGFVLPHAAGMRPWPMLRAGLYLYDLLAIGGSLPRSRAVGRSEAPFREPLKDGGRMALYWDAWVDDARLVVLNALDAAERGAEIATRTPFLSAAPDGEAWRAELGGGRTVRVRTIVNAAGAWVAEVLNGRVRRNSPSRARLVKGSHIVVPRLHEGEHAYILQQPDGRVVFALPYGAFTLVGTTDIPVDSPADTVITAAEVDYLCASVNRYFQRETRAGHVVWSYSGIRSLHDDGATSAQAITRDYHLELDESAGPRLLSVFGGKITTARALAEEVMDRLGVTSGRRVTATSALPGGDIYPEFNRYLEELARWMPPAMVLRLSRAYGTRLKQVIGPAASLQGLGRHYGAGLYEAEVRYLKDKEFARTAEDIVWRRTKLGLAMSKSEQKALAAIL